MTSRPGADCLQRTVKPLPPQGPASPAAGVPARLGAGFRLSRGFEPTPGDSDEVTALRLRIYNDGVRMTHLRAESRFSLLFAAIGAGVGLILVCLALVGCGVPASTYCYTAASATVHAVDTGMNVAGDLYREGKLPEATKVKLVASHDLYRPIAKGVVDGCRALQAGEQGKADDLIRRIQEAGAHVIEALTAAGVK